MHCCLLDGESIELRQLNVGEIEMSIVYEDQKCGSWRPAGTGNVGEGLIPAERGPYVLTSRPTGDH